MQKNLKYLSFFLFTFIILSSCKEENFEIFEEPKTHLDVSYGVDAAQITDIYLPGGRSREATRVILLIHGGGWMAGSKKDMEPFFIRIKEAMPGYAIVNMNYRLAQLSGSRYMLPMQTDDIESVINYVKKNADSYGVKPEFVLAGLSAGGHLAMLYSYKYDTGNDVKAVVNIVGPSNLNDTFYLNNLVYSFALSRITDPSNLPEGMSQSVFGSPVTWIKPKTQPTISFYGTNDEFIPHSQHSALEEALESVNTPQEKHLYEGGHNVGYDNKEDIIAKTSAFLEKQLSQ